MDKIALPKRESAPKGGPVHPWLSAQHMILLQDAAESYREHPDRLAARLLEKVLGDGLVGAVLDV
jgi:hypothetical protein